MDTLVSEAKAGGSGRSGGHEEMVYGNCRLVCASRVINYLFDRELLP